jgi:hypothetical protein
MKIKLFCLNLALIALFSLNIDSMEKAKLSLQEIEAPKQNNQAAGILQKSKDKLLSLMHAALDRGQGFQTPFSRGRGYWSKPEDEANTGYFSRLAEPETQREDWYKITPYISEFWCSLSNLGLLYVGLKHQSPEVLGAGLASMAYHSIPKQWLLHVDRAGVAFVLLKLATEYKTIQENPLFLTYPLAVAAINGIDVYLGQYQGKTWPHVLWHLSAAWMANSFLSATKKG